MTAASLARAFREVNHKCNKQPVSEVLDAAEQLDVDAQAELVAVSSRRLAERGRERVAASVAEARREFAAGQCKPASAGELVREALS